MCFSTPPTSSGCQVFGIQSIGYDTVSIGTIKVGDESWTINLFDNNLEFMVAKCNPVVCNGLFYCLGSTGNVGILELKEHESSWTTYGKPKQLLRKSQQIFLIENDGDLFAVVVNRDGRQVDVLKLDLKKAAWHEVQSLGDKMMYVCHFGSFSGKAVVRGTSNKVYFPKFYGSNGVFYSLATRKFHSFVGNYSRKDFYSTKEMKHCTWITPC